MFLMMCHDTAMILVWFRFPLSSWYICLPFRYTLKNRDDKCIGRCDLWVYVCFDVMHRLKTHISIMYAQNSTTKTIYYNIKTSFLEQACSCICNWQNICQHTYNTCKHAQACYSIHWHLPICTLSFDFTEWNMSRSCRDVPGKGINLHFRAGNTQTAVFMFSWTNMLGYVEAGAIMIWTCCSC